MKTKLIIIFILSVFDIGLSYWGIKAGFIEEMNPLLRYLLHTYPEITSLMVFLIISMSLYFIYKEGYQFRYINIGLVLMLAVKIFIMALHVGWIIQVV